MDIRESRSSLAKRHPWEAVRARFFCRVLTPVLGQGPLDLMDLGAGDGYLARRVIARAKPGSTMTCVDAGYSAEELERLNDGGASISFVRECPGREFGVVLLLDVLEHIDDDRSFLRDAVARHVPPGGVVLLSVPAHRALYTSHDVVLGHHRRYSKRELIAVAEAAGLDVVRAGGLFASLLLPRSIARVRESVGRVRVAADARAQSVRTDVGTWDHGRLVTGSITAALELDARICDLSSRLGAPTTGLSVWALCTRRTRT